MFYYLSETETEGVNAGNKARNDVEKILDAYIEERKRSYGISSPLLNQEERKFLNWKNRAIKTFSDIMNITDKEIIEDCVTLKTEKVFHSQATKISTSESVIELKDEVKGILKTKFSAILSDVSYPYPYYIQSVLKHVFSASVHTSVLAVNG